MTLQTRRRRWWQRRLRTRLILRTTLATVVAALVVGIAPARPASAPESHAMVVVREYLSLLADGRVVESCRLWSAKVYALNDHKKDRVGIAKCASYYRVALQSAQRHFHWMVAGAELVHPGLVVVHTMVAGGPHDFFVRRYGSQWFLDTADIT